ncbi:hypothetical protein Tco_1567927 [Tanacetum coccineum]
MAGEDENHDTNNSPQVPPTQQTPYTLSTIKLPILKKGVSTEDANQKFLRSLPASWSQVSLIMRTKPGVDSLSFDDLYNNLRVFEPDVKGSTGSSSSALNVAFVSSSTSSTNDVSTNYGVSTSSGHNSQREVISTNKTKIIRKPSKTDKHRHGKRKSTKEAKDSKPKPRKVNLQSKLVKPWSTKVNHKKTKPQNIPNQSLKFQKVSQIVPKA